MVAVVIRPQPGANYIDIADEFYRRIDLMEKDLPMPKAPYFELSTWATINFAYTYKNERMIAELVSEACEPEKVTRLLNVVRQRLGHRLAFAVEDAKIALSTDERLAIALTFLEAGLTATVTRGAFDGAIEAGTERLCKTASACIAAAGVSPTDITTLMLTGGSSRVPAVRAAIERAAPSARLAGGSDDFLSVPLGLTQMARTMT